MLYGIGDDRWWEEAEKFRWELEQFKQRMDRGEVGLREMVDNSTVEYKNWYR